MNGVNRLRCQSREVFYFTLFVGFCGYILYLYLSWYITYCTSEFAILAKILSIRNYSSFQMVAYPA